MAKQPTEKEEVVKTINLKRLTQATTTIRVEGTTPLMVHKFSAKARKQMLTNSMSGTGKTQAKATAKNPEAEFEDARYLLDGRDAVPAAAFKAALVSGARAFGGVTMVSLKTSVYVVGHGAELLIPLELKEPPIMREDTVRIANGAPDLRYRPFYWPWGALVEIKFIPELISLDSLYALLDAGGLSGIGEWRPSAPKSLTGSYGMFHVIEGDESYVGASI